MNIIGIQDELLRLEYPKLLPGHDPDIEHYFYLRSTNRDADAIVVYRARLIPRYPNDEFRTWLLRAYRNRDPAFPGLLAKGRQMLALRLLERTKAIIAYIAGKTESLNEKDVYSTIKTAEGILQILPRDRYEAMTVMDRYQRYAETLNLREDAIVKANELVQAYLTDSLSVVQEERQRRSEAERFAREQERQRLVRADYDNYLSQKEKAAAKREQQQHERRIDPRPPAAPKAHPIDLSSIIFSQRDLARIEIPPMRRIEDQVLAYCIKYWNMINDNSFERILFLYSRKYRKKNYDIYMTIRRGRTAKHRDDEILSSILSLLITGYYYSIRGDRYLLRSWNAVKATVEKQAVQTRPGSRPVKTAPAAKAAPAQAVPVKTAPVQPKPAVPVKNAPAEAAVPAQAAQAKAAPPEKVMSKNAVPAKPAAPLKAAPAEKAMSKNAVPAKPAVPLKAAPPVKTASKNAAPAKPAVPPKAAPAQETAVPAQAAQAKAVPPAKAAPMQPAQAVPVKAAPVQPKPAVSPKAAPAQEAVAPVQPKPAHPTHKPAPQKEKVPEIQTVRQPAVKGSVQDRLKELSGRSYDVYQDRFFAKVRGVIRKVLGKKKGLFANLSEEAENLVYNFLSAHYSDPFMNWEDAAERKRLFDMGFDLPSITPVIDECYKTL